jgi:hypothetical protein
MSIEESKESRKLRQDLKDIIAKHLSKSSDEEKENFLDDITYCIAEFHQGIDSYMKEYYNKWQGEFKASHKKEIENLTNQCKDSMEYSKMLEDKIVSLKNTIQGGTVVSELEKKLAVEKDKVRQLKSIVSVVLKEL